MFNPFRNKPAQPKPAPRRVITLTDIFTGILKEAGLRQAGNGTPGFSVEGIRNGVVMIKHIANDADRLEHRHQLKVIADALAGLPLSVKLRTSLNGPAHLVVRLQGA